MSELLCHDPSQKQLYSYRTTALYTRLGPGPPPGGPVAKARGSNPLNNVWANIVHAKETANE